MTAQNTPAAATATAPTAPTAPARKRLSRAVKAGSVVSIGALLLGSAGSLMMTQDTVKGQDTAIQAGQLSVELGTEQRAAYDITEGLANAKAIDLNTFLVSPHDKIRVVEGDVAVTVTGDNMRAKLTGTAPAVAGQLPIEVTTSLVSGITADGSTDLTGADVIASIKSTNAAGGEAVVDMASGAAQKYQIIQDYVIPGDVDISVANLSALISGSTWTIAQHRGAAEAPPAAPEEDLTAAWVIEDPLVEAAVRGSLHLATGEEYEPWDPEYGTGAAAPLTLAHAASLTTLSIDGDVSSFKGLEQAKNITSLDAMRAAGVTQLEPLAGMSKLAALWVGGTSADLTPLAGLPLEQLWVSGSPDLTDLGPLSGIKSLKYLSAVGIGATDLRPLSGLENLVTLSVSSAGLVDLSPLAGMTGLTTLHLSGSTVLTDLGPVGQLASLKTLWVKDAKLLSDLTPLSGILTLTLVHAEGTLVTNWSPVAHVATVKGRP